MWEWFQKLEGYLVIVFGAIVGLFMSKHKKKMARQEEERKHILSMIERLEQDHHNLERRQSDHGRAIGVISEKQASVQHELSDLKQEMRTDMDYLRLSLDRILDIITKK